MTLGLRSVNEASGLHTERFCSNGVLSVRYNRALIANASELTMSPSGRYVDIRCGRTVCRRTAEAERVLRNPDHSSAHTEQIKAEFKVTWTPSGGTAQSRSYITPLKASGLAFSYTVPSHIAENVPISWEVRASDNTSWGPWSSYGSRNVCQFLYDKSSPSPPDVDSAVYLGRPPDGALPHQGLACGRFAIRLASAAGVGQVDTRVSVYVVPSPERATRSGQTRGKPIIPPKAWIL